MKYIEGVNEYGFWEMLKMHETLQMRIKEKAASIAKWTDESRILRDAVELKELTQELKELERVTIYTKYKL